MANIALFLYHQNPLTDKPKMVQRRAAKRYFEMGAAVYGRSACGKKYIQFTKHFPLMESGGIRSAQGRAYEAAAIETIARPHLVGGLNRTEKQPARFQRFKAARVGHQ